MNNGQALKEFYVISSVLYLQAKNCDLQLRHSVVNEVKGLENIF